jgi:hypothetical protein
MTWFEQTLTVRDYEAFFAAEMSRLEAEISLMEEVVRTTKSVLELVQRHREEAMTETGMANGISAWT